LQKTYFFIIIYEYFNVKFLSFARSLSVVLDEVLNEVMHEVFQRFIRGLNMDTDILKNTKVYLNPKNKNLPAKQKILEYIILFIVSTTHLFLFSLWTSPFYKYWYGCDASFFTLVGRGITEGKVPYRDFFDLKGPYFFFIEALGQLMAKARLGAFLIQIPFAFFSLVLLYEISLLFISKRKTILVLIVYLWGFITTLWGGNTVEEFTLPLSLLCLYFVLKSVYKDQLKFNELPLWQALLLGACFTIDLFSKISVAAPVLGIIASIIFYDLFRKKYKDLLLFILYLLLGCAFATLPVLIYFGINESLSDMIHCVFYLGFSRSMDYYESFNITWELKLSGCIFAFFFGILHRDRIQKEIGVIIMAMSAAIYLLLHLGTPYYYYFTIVYPALCLALIMFLKIYDPLILFENCRQGLCAFLFLIFLFYYVPSGLSTVRTLLYDQNNDYTGFHDSCNEMASLIPESERDSVMSFMIDMQWFEATGITPCNRYVVNLPFFIALDPPVLVELLEMFENEPPKWLIIGDNFDGNLPDLVDPVYTKYQLIFENEAGHLYILQEDY